MNMPSAFLRRAFRPGVALVVIRSLLAQPAGTPLTFEVASVKLSDPGARNPNIELTTGGFLTISNVPLRGIITYAHDIRDCQLTGAPGWINDERFDILARPPATLETTDQSRNRVARARERLRSLLSDRFGLRVHIEQRERTVLALRVAKSGPGLPAATPKAEGDSGRLNFVTG